MKIKRTVGRFVLIEDDGFRFPIAFYMKEFNKIAVCFAGVDCISASQEINRLMKEQHFLDNCTSITL